MWDGVHHGEVILRVAQVGDLVGRDTQVIQQDGQRRDLGPPTFEYVKDDLKHLFAAADLLVSRAGANAICEILALGKPSLLIPLPTKGSRGDQILNANSFAEQGFSEVLEDEKAIDQIVDKVTALYENRSKYIEAIKSSHQTDAIPIIMGLLEEVQK